MTAARPMRRKSLLYSHPAVLQVAKPLGICSSSSGAEHSTGTAEAASYRTKEATGVHSTGLRQVFLGEEVRSLLLTVETTVLKRYGIRESSSLATTEHNVWQTLNAPKLNSPATLSGLLEPPHVGALASSCYVAEMGLQLDFGPDVPNLDMRGGAPA